jgi:hypothetical protein
MKQAAAALAALLLVGAQAPLPTAAPPAHVEAAHAPAGPPSPMETDPDYDASVAHPAYAAQHPRILFDAAHRNYHLPDGRYRPFAELIRNDGYWIETNDRPFTAEVLAGHDVLVIANAMGARGVDAYWTPAFTAAECRAVAEWVRGGGSLLLIADHAPFGTAAAPLAETFGVDMSKGVTADRGHADPDSGNMSFILYTRDAHMLGAHPILEGRDARERIGRVMTFSGQSLRGPVGSTILLALGDAAVDRQQPSEAEIRAAVAAAREQAQHEGRAGPQQVRLQQHGAPAPAAGRGQAIAFNFGRGRVVVLGEAAMLSAQYADMASLHRMHYPVGLNHPGLDNRQFALNLMHWLSHLIG